MQIELKVLDKELYETYKLPDYATPGSAAIDLIAAENIYLEPGETETIKTGIAIHIDSHRLSNKWMYYNSVAGLILPRSGLGGRGLVLANLTGVIDGDYQGELLIQAWNRLLTYPKRIHRGDRFAQMVFVPIVKPDFVIVDEFTEVSERGAGGFGHTGV